MKVDTNLINGFENMTTEEKLAAVLELDLDPTKVGFKTQESFDKIMSENADYKRKLKETEKTKTAENDDLSLKLTDLTEKYEALMKEKQIAEDIGQFVSMGYSQELAKEAAEAYAANDRAKMFAVQTKFLSERDQKAREAALKGMHGNQGGTGPAKNETDELLEFAKSFGKQKAEGMKATEQVTESYMIK